MKGDRKSDFLFCGRAQSSRFCNSRCDFQIRMKSEIGAPASAAASRVRFGNELRLIILMSRRVEKRSRGAAMSNLMLHVYSASLKHGEVSRRALVILDFSVCGVCSSV